MKEFDIESFEDGELQVNRKSKDIKNAEIDFKESANAYANKGR